MVSLSIAAARHLKLLLEERQLPAAPLSASSQGQLDGNEGACRGLRILVEKGGCAGLQYTMNLDVRRSGDNVVERDGVGVFIDPTSLPYLSGAELDYCDDLVGTGFRLRNPNAVRSCGCGTSFEPSAAAFENGDFENGELDEADGANGAEAADGSEGGNADKEAESGLVKNAESAELKISERQSSGEFR